MAELHGTTAACCGEVGTKLNRVGLGTPIFALACTRHCMRDRWLGAVLSLSEVRLGLMDVGQQFAPWLSWVLLGLRLGGWPSQHDTPVYICTKVAARNGPRGHYPGILECSAQKRDGVHPGQVPGR